MPKNKPRSGVLKQAYFTNDPRSVYSNHPLPKQIACYNLWCYLNSAGTESWKLHENCSSVNHRRSYQYLIDNIKRNSWPNVGKVRGSHTLLSLLSLLLPLGDVITTVPLNTFHCWKRQNHRWLDSDKSYCHYCYYCCHHCCFYLYASLLVRESPEWLCHNSSWPPRLVCPLTRIFPSFFLKAMATLAQYL